MKKKSVGAFSFFSFLGLALFLFYLWGKVQIDFVVRGNAQKKQAGISLQHEIDDLRIEINRLKSYQRITDLAITQGLTFLPPNRIEELPVDLSGLKPDVSDGENRIILAGMDPFSIRSKKQIKSWISGGTDGTR